jgi:hypothetical protein
VNATGSNVLASNTVFLYSVVMNTGAMPMYSSYDHEPVVELTSWSVFEVPLYGSDAPWTRHFVGFAEELGLAQVSSAIVLYDYEHSCGASANHRVFQLVGASGTHSEGAALWRKWKALNGVYKERDVTAHFHKELQAAMSAVNAMSV